MAVAYEEVKAPKLSIDIKTGVVTGVRVFKIDWADLQDFAAEVTTYPTQAGSGILQPPRATWPGNKSIWLSGISADPIDPDCIGAPDAYGIATGNGYFVTLTYTSVQANNSDTGGGQQGSGDPSDNTNSPKTLVTHRVNGSVRMLTVPHWGVQWFSSVGGTSGHKQVPEDVRPAVPEVVTEHHLTMHDAPAVPFNAIHARLGTANLTTIMRQTKGTLLFQSYDAVRQYSFDQNAKKWEISYKFLARINHGAVLNELNGLTKVGWNHFLRPDAAASTGPWQTIVDMDDDPLIPYTEFKDLFRYDPNTEDDDSLLDWSE